MGFLIKNLLLKDRKLILKLEKISTQDFNFFCSIITEYICTGLADLHRDRPVASRHDSCGEKFFL